MRNSRFLRKIQTSPLWQSLAEAFFTLLFTFAPIAMISYPLAASTKNVNANTFSENFLSFWTAGQITLPILGICGAVCAITVTNKKVIGGGWFFLSLSLCIILSCVCGYALSESDGFSESMYPGVVNIGFMIYAGFLTFWCALSHNVKNGGKGSNPESRAVGLLDKKNQMAYGDVET